jgi:hypothetical protein
LDFCYKQHNGITSFKIEDYYFCAGHTERMVENKWARRAIHPQEISRRLGREQNTR